YRLYLNKLLYELNLKDKPSGINGLYLSPHASFMDIRISTRAANRFDNYLNFRFMDINFRAGWQFELLNKVYIDFYSGLGYKENSYTLVNGSTVTTLNTDGLEYIFNSNLKINLGFNIGYRF